MATKAIHAALVHAATAYDRREERKAYHNPYALGQYLLRIDHVVADIAAGASPRAAIIAGFTDRLCDHLLRAIGEPKATREERASRGIAYAPASKREAV